LGEREIDLNLQVLLCVWYGMIGVRERKRERERASEQVRDNEKGKEKGGREG
jgi:hypothetical protein